MILVRSLLCPVLVGRGAEAGALAAALQQAESGDGGLVFLAGEAGAGKSRLGREVSGLASSRGFGVLTGRAAESALPAPFRPIAEALMGAARGGLHPDAPEIADYRPALGSVVPDWNRPGDGSAEVSAAILGEALVRVLSVAGRAGGLLVLEDLQWAGPETLAIVEHLAGQLAGTRVLCIATVRDDEPSAGLDTMRSMIYRRAASVVEVPRLKEQEVRQMAAACLGAGEVPDAVTRLLGQCDGLPFAVEEFIAAAVVSGELAGGAGGWRVDERVTTAVPGSITGSVRSRLAALNPDVGRVLVSAAVLGQEFEWSVLPVVAGMAEAVVLVALRQACAVQLIEPVWPGDGVFKFRHSLTRNAILSGQLPPQLARMSGRAAVAIRAAHRGLPGPWCELAAGLHQAAGEHDQAAALLLEAGRRALGRCAVAVAVTFLRDACELAQAAPPAGPALQAAIDAVLVDALALAGDCEQLFPVAERLIGRLGAAGTGLRQEALIRITVARAGREARPDAASAHLSAGRAIAAALHDTELAARADAVAARLAFDAGALTDAERLARRSLTVAGSAGPAGWAAEVAVDSLQVLGRRERVRDLGAARVAFERASQIAGDAGLAIQRVDALHELGTIEMLDQADPTRLCEARELARHAGAVSIASVIDLKLGLHGSLGTDLGSALADTQRCERAAHRIGATRVEALAASAQAFISGISADRPAADRAAERAEDILPGNPEILFTTWGFARVTASLFRGDLPAALQESSTAIGYADKVPQSAPRLAWAFYALLHAICDENGQAALERARAESAAVRWNRGIFAYAQGVLEGREGRSRRAAALAEEGHRLLLPFAPRWNHLLRWLTAPAAVQDQWGDPFSWLREAAVHLETGGHDRIASACRGMLRQAGEPVPRSRRSSAQVPDQLRGLGVTSRETDIFRLVAQGLTRTQIASHLTISPRTVDTHIASLIAKTGQANRRQLSAYAARIAPREQTGPHTETTNHRHKPAEVSRLGRAVHGLDLTTLWVPKTYATRRYS